MIISLVLFYLQANLTPFLFCWFELQSIMMDIDKNKICSGFYFGADTHTCKHISPQESGACMGKTEFKSEQDYLLVKSEHPYDKRKNNREEVLTGKLHPLPPEIETSSDPAIQAIIKARNKAFTFD